MRKLFLSVITTGLALVFMLTGCDKQQAEGESPPGKTGPVKIGALVPLTGALSEFGGAFRNAGDLAVQQFAEAGFPIELKYADTETSAIPGVEAARMLINVEKVVAIIGPGASGVTVPVAESVAIPGQVPLISNASTSPLITILPADQGKDFLFRTAPSDALQGLILGKLAADQGYKKAAVFWINNAYGQGLMEEFRKSFEAAGGEIIASVPHDEKPAPTYVSELKKVMQKQPDVMLALAYPGQATVYLKEFFEAKYHENTALLFCDGTKSVEMPSALGAENLAGFMGTAPSSVSGESRANFEKDYKAVYGEIPPLPFMANFYDGVVIAGLAAVASEASGKAITPLNVRDMMRSVSNEPGQVISAGVDGIRRAIELLRAGETINYEGAAGTQDFDANGDVVTPIEIWKYTENDPFIETVRIETP